MVPRGTRPGWAAGVLLQHCNEDEVINVILPPFAPPSFFLGKRESLLIVCHIGIGGIRARSKPYSI
jgi:hypothetical protein